MITSASTDVERLKLFECATAEGGAGGYFTSVQGQEIIDLCCKTARIATRSAFVLKTSANSVPASPSVVLSLPDGTSAVLPCRRKRRLGAPEPPRAATMALI